MGILRRYRIIVTSNSYMAIEKAKMLVEEDAVRTASREPSRDGHKAG